MEVKVPESVVYTVITGGYDVPLPVRERDPGLRYVLYTDAAPRFRCGWEVRRIPDGARALGPVLANRWCKFFAHRLFPDCASSLYLDGNIRVLGPLQPLFAEFAASGQAIGLCRHPQRHSIAEEVEACTRLGKFKPRDLALIDAQLARYRAGGLGLDGAPSENGELSENGAILRNHRHPGLAPAMDLWWREMTEGVHRDQVSLPWVRASTGLPTWWWPTYRAANPYLLGPFWHRPRMTWFQNLTYVAKSMRADSPLREAVYLLLRVPSRAAELLKDQKPAAAAAPHAPRHPDADN
jgi:hypothetical protein